MLSLRSAHQTWASPFFSNKRLPTPFFALFLNVWAVATLRGFKHGRKACVIRPARARVHVADAEGSSRDVGAIYVGCVQQPVVQEDRFAGLKLEKNTRAFRRVLLRLLRRE